MTVSWESEFDETTGAWERTAAAYRDEPPTSEAGRYCVYSSHACPWATRVKMVLVMLGLERAVTPVDCDPVFGVIDEAGDKTGWVFSERFPDRVEGRATLREVYLLGNPEHASKSSTPMLWDTRARRVINNESKDMVVLIHDRFRDHAEHPEVDLFPTRLRPAIFAFYDEVYGPLLNGVYRAGFARKQEVHDEAVAEIFATLDALEARLSAQRWVMGDRFTFADIILFPTLWRFDFVYAIHFKCSLRRIQDYPALRAYVREIYSWPTTRRTNVVDLTRRHYYGSHYLINPHRIVAKVDLSWMDARHGREALAQRESLWFMT